jgi:hypothetical protein
MTTLRDAVRTIREQVRREQRDAEADWVTAQYVPEKTP